MRRFVLDSVKSRHVKSRRFQSAPVLTGSYESSQVNSSTIVLCYPLHIAVVCGVQRCCLADLCGSDRSDLSQTQLTSTASLETHIR